MQLRYILLYLLTTLAFINEVASQKKINLKIITDKNIDVNLLSIYYDNGIKNESINKNNLKNYLHGDSIIVNTTNYAKKMGIEIYYYSPITKSTSNYILLTNNEECLISLKEKKNKLVAKKISNLELIQSPDTINNNFLRDIVKSKEYKTYIDAFNYTKQNPLNRDSIRHVRKQHTITLNEKIITIATKYQNEYFTFWYFRNKVAGLSLLIIPDEPHSIQKLFTAFITLFPKELVNSIEGNYAMTKLQSWGHATIKEGDTIADFQVKDFFGREIRLYNTTSKYTLLFFWATWCPPCLAELPNIKKANTELKNTSALRIIGISLDRDKNKWGNYVTKENLEWDNIISDDNNKLVDLFKISSIPQAYILDSNKRIMKIFSGYADSDINNYISKLDR